MGLGSLNAVSLSEARDKATESRRLRSEGIDPIQHRRQLRVQSEMATSISFKEAADRYIEAVKAEWRSQKNEKQWRASLANYAYPIIGNNPVHEIDVKMVLRVLDPIWRLKPETASRLRGRIERILDWANVQGYREGDNPARWKEKLSSQLPSRSKLSAVRHFPALPYVEVSEFMENLRYQSSVAARALELTILTAVRTNEVIGAEWGELNFDQATWSLPGGRMKAGKLHRIPLSEHALRLFINLHEQRDPASQYVFPGQRRGKHISNMGMLKLLQRMGSGDITVHGFRSTFRDWAAEQTNYPREVAEAALAHVNPNKTETAYQRGDLFEKRRLLMNDWSNYCYRVTYTGDVVPIRQSKS